MLSSVKPDMSILVASIFDIRLSVVSPLSSERTVDSVLEGCDFFLVPDLADEVLRLDLERDDACYLG